MFLKDIVYEYLLSKKFENSYIKLVKKNKLNLLNELKKEIYNLVKIDQNFKNTHSQNFKSTIVHQYLISKFIFNNFLFNAICINGYITKKKIILPLPYMYLKVIEKNGIKVNYFCSKLLLYNFYIFILIINILKILKLFFLPKKKVSKNFSIFFSLSKNNLPLKKKSKGSVIEWAINNFDISKLILVDHYKNDEKVYRFKNYEIFREKFLSYLKIGNINQFKSIKNISQYLLEAFSSFFKTDKFDLIMLYEKTLKDFVIKSKIDNHITSCFYHHSSVMNGYIYRPYWTYFVESKINFYMYFYSISFDHYKDKRNLNNTLPFNLITWPNLITWNNLMKNYIYEKNNFKINYIMKEPVSFISGYKSFKIEYGIVIFDQFPSISKIFYSAGHNSTYPKYKIATRFVNDIIEIAKEFDLPIYIKNKRKGGKNYNQKYMIFLENLINRKIIKKLDYDIPYENLFYNQKIISICKPFTSIAFVSEKKMINTIYYDCTKRLLNNKIAQGDIKLVSGKQKLKKYIEKNLDVFN